MCIRDRSIDNPDSLYSSFLGTVSNPTAIGYENGNLYVADAPTGERKIVVLDASDGSYRERFGTLGNAPDQLNMPSEIEVKNGYIYVVDMGNHAIKVFAKK